MLCLKVLKYNNLSHKSLCNFCNVNIVCWECYLPSARRDLSWMMNNGKIHTNGSRQLSAVNAALLTTDFVYDANKKLRIRASFWYIKFVQNFRVCHARTNLSARERECGSSSPSLQMVVIKIDMYATGHIVLWWSTQVAARVGQSVVTHSTGSLLLHPRVIQTQPYSLSRCKSWNS